MDFAMESDIFSCDVKIRCVYTIISAYFKVPKCLCLHFNVQVQPNSIFLYEIHRLLVAI